MVQVLCVDVLRISLIDNRPGSEALLKWVGDLLNVALEGKPWFVWGPVVDDRTKDGRSCLLVYSCDAKEVKRRKT